jgi:hypothetical protein
MKQAQENTSAMIQPGNRRMARDRLAIMYKQESFISLSFTRKPGRVDAQWTRYHVELAEGNNESRFAPSGDLDDGERPCAKKPIE